MSAETIDQAKATEAPDAEGAAPSAAAATQPVKGQPAPKADSAQVPASKDDQAAEAGQPEQGGTADVTYDFKTPEGREPYAPELLVAFGEVAKKHGLNQEAAQGVLDDMAPAIVQRLQDVHAKRTKEWRDAMAADPEIGGSKQELSKKHAGVLLDKFGTPELREWLDESGAGDQPELARLFTRAGQHFAEDTVVTGAPPPARPKTLGEKLFPEAVRKK